MSSVLIIAEAGVNHNGSLETALELVRVAAEAKVDIVKFQTFKAQALTTNKAQLAEYQKNNLSAGDKKNLSQQEMLMKLELPYSAHRTLIEECKKYGLGFLSTAFDFESVDFLKTLNLGLWKIPSGEITNLPYLEKIAAYKQKIILSTGMSEMHEVADALVVLEKNGASYDDLTVLHCNTEYPTPMTDVNLRAMLEIKNKFQVKVGYSDHTLGIEVPIAAVAMGATIIEKHFTLSRQSEGPDHAASLEPQELKEMVKAIRNIEKALGSSQKTASASEIKNRSIARKSIVAAQAIKQGELFTEANLTTRRPGTGVSPMRWHDILGTHATKDYAEGELL